MAAKLGAAIFAPTSLTWHDLKEDNIRIGRNRIARLMRENDLKAHQKRRFKKTTDSEHKGRIAPNLAGPGLFRYGARSKVGGGYILYLDRRGVALSRKKAWR